MCFTAEPIWAVFIPDYKQLPSGMFSCSCGCLYEMNPSWKSWKHCFQFYLSVAFNESQAKNGSNCCTRLKLCSHIMFANVSCERPQPSISFTSQVRFPNLQIHDWWWTSQLQQKSLITTVYPECHRFSPRMTWVKTPPPLLQLAPSSGKFWIHNECTVYTTPRVLFLTWWLILAGFFSPKNRLRSHRK